MATLTMEHSTASGEAGTIVAGLPMPLFRRITVTPISGACGCEIGGVDLRQPLDEESWPR